MLRVWTQTLLPPSRDDDALFRGVWEVYRFAGGEYRRVFLHAVHRPGTGDDVGGDERLHAYRVLFLFREVPEDHRGDTGVADAVLGGHRRLCYRRGGTEAS
jgi:hypothetical protein